MVTIKVVFLLIASRLLGDAKAENEILPKAALSLNVFLFSHIGAPRQ
jgi:hypothetical protein